MHLRRKAKLIIVDLERCSHLSLHACIMCAYVYMYVCECRCGCDRVHMQRSENNLRCQSLPSSSFEAGPLSWLCLLACCRSTETADAHHPTRLWTHVVTLAWQPSFPLNLLPGPHTSLLPSEGCSFFHCGLVLLEWCHAVWTACLASVTGIWACTCFVLFSVFLSFTTLSAFALSLSCYC